MRLRGLILAVVVSTFAIQGELVAQTKVAVVDIQRALTSVKEGKKAKRKMEREVKGRQKEFDEMQKELKALKDELEQKGPLMKEDVRRRKIQEYQRKLMELQQYYLDNQKKLTDMEARLTKPILDRFHAILTDIGKKEGYTLILERSAVIYFNEAVDLTDRLISDFNAGKGTHR